MAMECLFSMRGAIMANIGSLEFYCGDSMHHQV